MTGSRAPRRASCACRATASEFVSLVHITDMAAATVKAVERWPSRQALIVGDDAPVRWRDLFGFVADGVGRGAAGDRRARGISVVPCEQREGEAPAGLGAALCGLSRGTYPLIPATALFFISSSAAVIFETVVQVRLVPTAPRALRPKPAASFVSSRLGRPKKM